MMTRLMRNWFFHSMVVCAGFFLSIYSLFSEEIQRNENFPRTQQNKIYEQYVEYKTEIIPRVWPEEDWSPEDIPDQDEFRIRNIYRVPCFTSYSPEQRFRLIMGVEHDVLVIVNRKLDRKYIPGPLGRPSSSPLPSKEEGRPQLTVSKAIDQAYRYLDVLEQEIPGNYAIADVFFGTDGDFPETPFWRVVWKPCVEGVFFDESDEMPKNNIQMVFHEKKGLARYSRKVDIFPSPETMEIEVQPAQAARKAALIFPQVLQTGVFRGWRGEREHKGKSRLVETRLVIFEPNWMLDPHRSIVWTPESREPPKETRLCWRIEFEVGGEYDPDTTGSHLPTNIIWIFIDAQTGECVGANFN